MSILGWPAAPGWPTGRPAAPGWPTGRLAGPRTAHRTVGGPRTAHRDGWRPPGRPHRTVGGPRTAHRDGWRPPGPGPGPGRRRGPGRGGSAPIGAAGRPIFRQKAGFGADFSGFGLILGRFWEIPAEFSAEIPGPGQFSGLKAIDGRFGGGESSADCASRGKTGLAVENHHYLIYIVA